MPSRAPVSTAHEEKAAAEPLPPATVPTKKSAPAPAAAQNGSAVRLGRTEVPSNIPNLGGRRPKQAQAVRLPSTLQNLFGRPSGNMQCVLM